MKRLSIIALSLATALASALPAEAFPTMAAAPDVEAQQAQLVRYRGYYGGYHGGYYGGHGGYYHHHGGDGWGWALGGLAAGAIIGGMLAQPGYYGSGYYGSGYYDPGYYGGYSGPYYYGSTRYYARRYYYPRTYYYPRAYYGGNSHVRWCFARYRSYRAYDNTFQPYYGPRQACVSPQY